MIARRFFYVCAGLLCLALMYHLSASRAGAQAAPQAVAAAIGYQGSEYAITSDGRIFSRGGPAPSEPWYLTKTVAVPSPVVDMLLESAPTNPNPSFLILCADGTAFDCQDIYGSCTASNMFGAPTAATRGTWGATKVHYR